MSGGQETLKLGNITYVKKNLPHMAHARNDPALIAQLNSSLRQADRLGVLAGMGLDPTGPGAQGAPATKNERNAATYARFKKEYNTLQNRLVEGQQLSQQNLNRYAALPGLMAQHAPKKPNLAIAAPGAGAAGAPGRNLPSPGMGLGALANMFGLGAGKSRRRRNRRKSRKNRRRSRKN